jgi:O-antigen/teichoic acid export membrane protein
MRAETADSIMVTGPDRFAERRDSESHAFRTIASQTASGMVWTGVALLLGFALKILLTHKMLAREMGIVLAAQSFVGLAVVISTLGIPDAVVRFLGIEATRDAAPRRTVQVALQLVAAATGTVAVVVIAALAWFDSTMSADARRATIIMVLALPLLALGDVVGAAYRGVNRLGTKILIVDVARPGAVVIGLLLSPVALTRHAPYVAGLYAGAAFVTLAVGWMCFRRDRRWQSAGTTTTTPSEMLRFGIPIAGAVLLAGPIINNVLPLMLSAWTGPAAVAFYAVALSLYGVVYLPVGILEQAVTPTWAQMAARAHVGRVPRSGPGGTDALADSYRRYTNICFAAAAGLGLVIVANAETILILLFGPSFEAAASSLKMVIVGTLCGAVVGPNEGMLHALGFSTSIFNGRLIGAAAGLGAGAMLIPAYGLSGAVGAAVVTMVGINTMYAVILYRKTGLHPFTPTHAATTGVVALGLLAATMTGGYPGIGWIAANALAATVVVANADLRLATRELLRSVTARV